MAERPTTGEPYKAKAILEEDVVAAVEAFMADPTTSAFIMGEGYTLDLAEAVQSHEWAKATVEHPTATEHLKRTAVRTAILLAQPVKEQAATGP